MNIDTSYIIRIKGVTNDIIQSFGTVSLQIYFNDCTIEHIFHVVPDSFNIPADGILGKDFNKIFKCKIDYEDMTLTIRADDFNIVVPIQEEPRENTIALPAWCRTFRIFTIQNFSTSCLIPAQQIEPGVFIPNFIARDSKVIIPVLNTNEEMKIINNKLKNGIDINNFDIYSMNSEKNVTGNDGVRINKLAEYFSKTTPKHLLKDLLNLCEKYTDVFMLPDDKMSVNHFYKQKLRLKNDTPIYSKNYRLPHAQKAEIEKQVSKLLANDLIEPSTSCFNSPLIVVPKKSQNGEKKWRMCVDDVQRSKMRKLQSKIIRKQCQTKGQIASTLC